MIQVVTPRLYLMKGKSKNLQFPLSTSHNHLISFLNSFQYIKIILFEKLNVAVIIIIMLEILLKKMAHIENVSNFYTY